jgi:hypothetical protein
LTVVVSGTGYGKTVEREVSEETTEVCDAGRMKKIDAIFPVEITPMGFFRRGKPEFGFTHAEVTDRMPMQWVATYCDLQDVQGLLDAGGPILNRKQVPGDNLTRKDTKNTVGRRSVSLGVSAESGGFSLQFNLSAEVYGSEKYEILSTLPGGHAYRPYAPRDGLGLVWMEHAG